MTDWYPWLDAARAALNERLRRGDMPHALLVSGPAGIGKMALVSQLAAMLLCEQKTPANEPCGQCAGCRMFAASTHPDFFLVTRLPDEKTGKAAASIKVDQIREMTERLALSSHRAGWKLAVVAPADAMNLNASNSLLKTLEEPTDNTVLVLVSDCPARLPATIRSRCQQLRLGVPAFEPAAAWLKEQLPGIDAGRYLQLAAGAPLAALRLAQARVIEQRQACFQSLLDVLAGNADPLAVAAEWARDEELQAVQWLRVWLQDLVKLRLAGVASGIRSVDLREPLGRLATRLDARMLLQQLDHLQQLMRVNEGVLNRQLMTEDVLLSWATLTQARRST